MNPVTQEMFEQFHERIKQYRLREGFKSSEDFDVSKVVSPASIKKWADKDEKSLFKAAKANDKSALEYIFWKMKGAIHGAFWKNYLGPDGGIRKQRINNDAWEEWLSIAWMAMTGGFTAVSKKTKADGTVNDTVGALDKFDPEKAGGNLMGNFAARYRIALQQAAINENYFRKSGGISGDTGTDRLMKAGVVNQYEPTWAEKGESEWNPDNDDTGTTGPGYEDETFDKVETSIEIENFLKKWRNFSQNSELYKEATKGVTPAEVFYEVLSNKNAEFRAMGTKFGISHNSVRTILQKAIGIMEGYSITNGEMMEAIRILGNDKVASYLHPAEGSFDKDNPPAINSTPAAEDLPETADDGTAAPKEAPPKTSTAKKPKAGSEKTIMERFEDAMMDEKMWTPHAKGTDAANCMNYLISNNFASSDKLAKKTGLRATDIDWFLRRAWRILKKVGITPENLKKEVKAQSIEAFTHLIGEDNTDNFWNE